MKLWRRAAFLLALVGCVDSAHRPPLAGFTEIEFASLPGWSEAPATEFAAAKAVFAESCRHRRDDRWRASCKKAQAEGDPRRFFEENFRPYSAGERQGLLTGYYQPLFSASRVKTEEFSSPIHGPPTPMPSVLPSRAEINANGLKNAEVLAWLRPVEAFFLAIQGSGLLQFADGKKVRARFAAKNRHPYRSIGALYAERSGVSPSAITAAVLREFIITHPREGRELMEENPSYIFFRLEDTKTPLVGAVGVPLLAYRSIAVDFRYVPPLAPLWVVTSRVGEARFPRLMFAHDTGSAIKGAVRGDIFVGSGFAAGEVAGGLQRRGFYSLLLPR